MRIRTRALSALATAALALGGFALITVAAPAAHADVSDCLDVLQVNGFINPDTVGLCHATASGGMDARDCARHMEQKDGVDEKVAQPACLLAQQ